MVSFMLNGEDLGACGRTAMRFDAFWTFTGTPKWMVKIVENPIKMDDLGVSPYFWKHPYSH